MLVSVTDKLVEANEELDKGEDCDLAKIGSLMASAGIHLKLVESWAIELIGIAEEVECILTVLEIFTEFGAAGLFVAPEAVLIEAICEKITESVVTTMVHYEAKFVSKLA